MLIGMPYRVRKETMRAASETASENAPIRKELDLEIGETTHSLGI